MSERPIILGPGEGHDFANRTSEPATAFNVFVPGGFEEPFRGWIEGDSA